MSIDDYFKKTAVNMPKPQRGRKTEGGDEILHAIQEASRGDANTSSGPTAVTSDANAIIHALTAVIDSKLSGVTEQIEKMETSVTHTVDKKIADVTQMIETKLASVLEAIAARGSEIQALAARMDIADKQMEAIDQTAAASETKIVTLEKQIKQLKERTDQLENHSRRSNLRILGIEERVEGTNAVKYLERWIPEYLHLDTADDRIVLDRAHRTLGPMPSSGQRPRPFIVKFHYYSDKARVMEAARKLLHQNGTPRQQRILFFNDYSAEVVRKRKAYDVVKARLRELEVEYALLYPDILRVNTDDGKYRRFSTPGEANVYVRTLELARAPPSLSAEGD
ncbi:unnamed protein product [Knipowitschia caucasica]|uniref:L1 transposable element RRM domain-containing protein n=1 Tax=Knipowitschia caucasica TaxID=637954 RepID=A0AAV2JHX8_KNICA